MTSEVVFSMPMVSLPVGGMMMRMACGSVTALDERAVHAQRLSRLGLAGSRSFKAGTHDFRTGRRLVLGIGSNVVITAFNAAWIGLALNRVPCLSKSQCVLDLEAVDPGQTGRPRRWA